MNTRTTKRSTNVGRWRLGVACWLLAVSVVGWTNPAWTADADEKRSGRIKAAFVYNFIDYIEWPEDRQPEAYRIAILGGSSVAGPLGTICDRRKVRGKEMRLVEYADSTTFESCEVVYVSADQEADFEDIQRHRQNATALVIGETPGLAEAGVVAVNIVPDGRSARFEVNLKALERAGLKARAQLLKLATLVGK